MGYWFGLFLVVSGLASLVFNEFTVQVRRIWPWRHDDTDPERDAWLNEYYRCSVYAGSILSMEAGQWLADIRLAHWLVRLGIYVLFGGWLLIRRPSLRRSLC